MSEQTPGFNPEQDPETLAAARKKQLEELRDTYYMMANKTERNVAEAQSTKFEKMLYIMMSRSQDNPDLINALNRFIDALDKQAMFGIEDESFGTKKVDRLTKFLEEQSEKLEDVEGGE